MGLGFRPRLHHDIDTGLNAIRYRSQPDIGFALLEDPTGLGETFNAACQLAERLPIGQFIAERIGDLETARGKTLRQDLLFTGQFQMLLVSPFQAREVGPAAKGEENCNRESAQQIGRDTPIQRATTDECKGWFKHDAGGLPSGCD